jgi:hypothetical protein
VPRRTLPPSGLHGRFGQRTSASRAFLGQVAVGQTQSQSPICPLFCPVDSCRRGDGESLNPPEGSEQGVYARRTVCGDGRDILESARKTGADRAGDRRRRARASSGRLSAGHPWRSRLPNSPNSPIPSTASITIRTSTMFTMPLWCRGLPAGATPMPHWSVYEALHVSADRQIPTARTTPGLFLPAQVAAVPKTYRMPAARNRSTLVARAFSSSRQENATGPANLADEAVARRDNDGAALAFWSVSHENQPSPRSVRARCI